MGDVDGLHDWLVRGAPGATTAADVIAGFAEGLLAAGIPVDRLAAFVRTLHPHIMGRRFSWEPGQSVRVSEASYAVLTSPDFVQSPIAHVFSTGEVFRHRLTDAASPRRFPMLDELANEGFTDYLAVPLRFLSGQIHAGSFATKRPGGFSDRDIECIERVNHPLARLAEILALSRTAANLLDTYVGREAGERIIAGKIVRGDTETIRAVIWMSDLRGFTELAGAIEPRALIAVLNDLFDCQVPAIERHGGEVLKFMGDGLLAIFPLDAGSKTARERTDAALAAAVDAYTAVAKLNAARVARGEVPIRFGLALHVGDVNYGNIGGASRLDFTCIGPAVNVAARLEGLTGKLGRPVVTSAEFARVASGPLEEVGTHALKGVADPQPVFAPTDPRLAHW